MRARTATPSVSPCETVASTALAIYVAVCTVAAIGGQAAGSVTGAYQATATS